MIFYKLIERVTDIPCESTPRTKAQTRSHSTLYILLIIKNQPLIILTWNWRLYKLKQRSWRCIHSFLFLKRSSSLIVRPLLFWRMTTSSTSSTTTAFSSDFTGVLEGSLEAVTCAFAFGTLAPVSLALWTTGYFFWVDVFSGAGFDVRNSFTNWAAAWRASFSASFCFRISALAARCTFRASFASSSAYSLASFSAIYSLASTTLLGEYISILELSLL